MSEKPGEKYAFLQLLRAVTTSSSKKITQWRDVLSGMDTGELTVGSRTPVAGMPKWATPEVVRGGFATTRFAAGGALQPHEITMAGDLGLPISDVSRLRHALNTWHLSDEGLNKLRQQANEGTFASHTPEETALLIIALLLEDDPDTAETILKEISPFFDRLRFYPAPGQAAPQDGVFLRNVRQMTEQLGAKMPRYDIMAQHRTLTLWIPLYDRLVDLLADHGTEGWAKRADLWFRDYEQALAEPTPERWLKKKGQFQRAKQALIALREGKPDQKVSATIVNRHRAKYGSGEDRDAYRQAQSEQNVRLWHDKLAKVIIARCRDLAQEIGITDPDQLTRPIAEDEALQGAPAGSTLPRSFKHCIHSARMGPIEALIEGGQIGAPEVLAKILPEITARVYTADLPNDAERTIGRTLYSAFRNRRSLLLLNLQSQIRIEELPWADALFKRRARNDNIKAVSKQVLSEIVGLSLRNFPHVIFPNKLVQEFSALAKRAELDIPFTNEIAADIFMGTFSSSYVKAAEISLNHYQGTLYGRYYDLPDVKSAKKLDSICIKRAGFKDGRNWSVASNGMIIEQQQIITSHNMAQVLTHLDLAQLDFQDMAYRCFDWIHKRQQTPLSAWRARLQMTKNCAYAWRQMIAYMSELDDKDQSRVFYQIQRLASTGSAKHRECFAPALAGLESALSGGKPAPEQVFLGWAQGRHPFVF